MATWVHNLDPFLIQFPDFMGFHEWGIRWYGLAYLGGFLAGYSIIRRMSLQGKSPLPADQVADFITYVAIGTLLGGRLGYATFYSPELWTDFSGGFPYWGVLKVQQGGMASHGGIFGLFMGCWLYARKFGYHKLHLLDLTCLGGALGVGFGRIANFINGELYGRECSPTFFLAVKFPQEMLRWLSEAPEKLVPLSVVAEKIGPLHNMGEISRARWESWVNSGWSGREKLEIYVEEMIRRIQAGDHELAVLMEPFLTPRYPSQLFQAVMEGFLVWAVLALVWRKPRPYGVISACFGMVYAVMRIIGEQFRLPDAHIGFQALGLTRGQWLSIVFFLIALALFVYARRRQPGKN